MKRRPWLAIVVLVLLGISAATFAHVATSDPSEDGIAVLLGDDVLPCEAPSFECAFERVAILVEDPPLTTVAPRSSVIAIAPKTSPPR